MSSISLPSVNRPPKNRAGFSMAVRQTLTMARRSLLKVRRTPEHLFDVTFQPILFILMFTYIFGGAVAGDAQGYLPMIVPAILIQTLVGASVASGVQLRDDMDKGVFDRFKAMPIARVAPLAGILLADMVRYAIAAVLTFGMGFLIGYRPEGGIAGVALAIVFSICCAWALSWIFAFFGVIARDAASVQGISMVVLFPLMFVSNAFVPVETMPGWLRWFAEINPISHMIAAVRGMVNQGTMNADFAISLLGAAAIVAIFALIAVRVYMRRV
ncbi:MAG: ABC transporter permease [Planifilum fulgidum]